MYRNLTWHHHKTSWGAITFNGTTTFVSSDGVITFTGTVPLSGPSNITSCKEFDIPEAITTTCTLGGGAQLIPSGAPTVYHIVAALNEVPGQGKDID